MPHHDRRGLAPLRPQMNREQARYAKEPIINAEVVRTRRRQLQLSQTQLAIMAACNPATIRRIEQGRNLDPPTSITLRLAKSLSCTVESLCRGARPYSGRISRLGNRPGYTEGWEVNPEFQQEESV